MSFRHTAAAAMLAAITLASAATTFAQEYPTRPIRIIVPFTPGGATDILARLLSQRFYEAFGQVATVENRAGAGGNIGTEVVVKSPPDVMNDESPALRGSTFILSFSPSTVTAPSSRSA
jgi:tripartite-type tricarboxylate transporter receptor subunit TctC